MKYSNLALLQTPEFAEDVTVKLRSSVPYTSVVGSFARKGERKQGESSLYSQLPLMKYAEYKLFIS